MTDPIDETRPQPTTADGPASAAAPGSPPPAPDTATPASNATAPDAAATGSVTPAPAGLPAAPPPPSPEGAGPGLRVDPDRPSDPAWREPAWFPPRDGRPREHRSGAFAIVVGLIFIAVGLWYFLQATLGIDLPRIRWSTLWPLILIVIGGLILVRSMGRRP